MNMEETIDQVLGQLEESPSYPNKGIKDAEMKLLNKGNSVNDLPVYRVEKGESHLQVIHDLEEDILYVPAMWMDYKGHFSQLMDFLVEEKSINHIKFTNVINKSLEKRLNGFEVKKEKHEYFDEDVKVLEGNWRLEND